MSTSQRSDDKSSLRRGRDRRSASPPRRGHHGDGASDEDSTTNNTHPRVLELGAQPLTSDDYYQRSAELRHWLLHSGTARRYRKDLDLSANRAPPEGGIYLDELTSKEAHRLFDKFSQRWNEGKLDDEYYLGKITSSSALGGGSSTGYKWKFAGNRSDKERDELERARDGVDSMTNSNSRGAQEARDKERSKSRRRDDDRGRKDGGVGGVAEPSTATATATGANANARDAGWGNRATSAAGQHHSDARFEQEEAREAQRRASQAARRAERRDARDIEEETNPRATGREAVLEKRRERNRDRKDFEAQTKGDGDVHLTESDLMGGDDSFQAACVLPQIPLFVLFLTR